MKTCESCGKKIGPLETYFEFKDGKIICRSCNGNKKEYKSLKDIIHLGGIPFLSGKKCDIHSNPNSISILEVKHIRKGLFASERTFGEKYTIPLDRLIDIRIKNDTEITEGEKKVLGRAVAGGVLFGGAGAVVGAISAPSKKEVFTKLFFIIEYLTKDGENKKIIFSDYCTAEARGMNWSSTYMVRNTYDAFIDEVNKLKNPNKSNKDFTEL